MEMPDAASMPDAAPPPPDAMPMPDAEPVPGDECQTEAQCGGDTPVCDNGYCVACAAAGTACNDGSECTENDACTASGTCVGDAFTDTVYRFVRRLNGADDMYYYSSSAAPIAGFELDAPAFRLAPPGDDLRTLHLLYSASAQDYMVSLDPNEGDAFGLGYDPVEEVGLLRTVEYDGAVELRRYYRAAPLRHFATLDPAEVPAGFSPDLEPLLGYVCPVAGAIE
jgi:hypothetical protein